MLYVDVLETTELGDRSYVVHDAGTAIVVDPQRDIDRVEDLLAERGVSLAAVVETHIHNDYVTGGLELARRAGALYLVSADDKVGFERRPVADGDELTFGDLRLRVIATPGHTDHHLSYLVESEGSSPGVFTGGSLLFGSVGRTDLLGDDLTQELTRAQFRSARRLSDLLSAQTHVYPTHGFGSFCSSGAAAGGDSSTIEEERRRNDALTEDDEEQFVSRLIGGLTAYPAYYTHMGARNAQGPGPADLRAPEPVEATALRKRIEAGEWVVDVRHRRMYSAAHLPGSIGIELGGQFSTYLGWLIPWETPITLIGESHEQVADAQRQLVRIGIERPEGAAVGNIEDIAGSAELGSFDRATFEDLRGVFDEVTVLDVRRDDERAQAALPGSTHIPLHSLLRRLDEVPSGTLWVHCATGFRAAIAASLLDRAGHHVVLVDDEFDKARELEMS